MKRIFIIITALALTACAQTNNPDENIKEILELSQYETLTRENYNKINQLLQECPEEIDLSLKENDALYLFKMELLDAVHEDAFYAFNDTLALQRRVEICSWVNKEYPEGSEERKAADSKLIETYTLWKKFDIAEKILDQSLESTTSATLDHANCKYTQGWFYFKKGDIEKAKAALDAALDEFHDLKDMGYAIMMDPQLSDEQFEAVNNGIQETKRGIKDCEDLMKEISEKDSL